MSSPAPSRKRSRYAIAETSTEHEFVAVDAVLTLLTKRSIPPTLQLVSRVTSSALSARIGSGIIFDAERLVELISIAKGIFILGPAAVGGGGPLHVSVVPSVRGNTKRDISARLRAFREAVAAVAVRIGSDDEEDDNRHHADDTLTVASTFGTSSIGGGDAEITAFPTVLADEWVQRAVAEMALESKPLRPMPSPPPPPPPTSSSTLATFDTPLLTISTRGLASRAGGVWPLVQRQIDDGKTADVYNDTR